MLFSSILTFLVAILFIVSNRFKTINWFFSSILFIVSFGILGSYMEYDLIPYLKTQVIIGEKQIILLEYFCGFLLSCGHFMPYPVSLLFSIYLTNYMNNKKPFQHFFLAFLIFIPTIVSFILFPVQRQFNPDFRFLAFWTGIYLFLVAIIQWRVYKNAVTIIEKREKLFISIIVVIGLSSQYFIIFVTQAFGIKNIWQYGYMVVTVIVIICIAFTIKYGILGLKIKFENIRMEAALKTINSSTLIYNHAVKNEVAKIHLCSQTIINVHKQIKDENLKQKISKCAEIIENSTHHLLNLVDRIKDGTCPIILNDTIFSLKDLIDETLKGVTEICKNNGIVIDLNIKTDYKIKADYTHIRECLGNIVKNSIEAINNTGFITVSIAHKERFLVLHVKDNGVGIHQDKLSLLFDPFYSTKKHSDNFGLGLFYCYNVMKKHGGNIEIKSVLGTETIVSLIFPLKRVLGIPVLK
ncbi:UNVERIFIED_CONTAM: histidine kinase/DNA gyrase B/HSP90-like ATPase [Acetivibrio alkalicellulosi]